MSSKNSGDDSSNHSYPSDLRAIFSSLIPSYSSETRNCRPDLNNRNMMICNVREKKITNIDGKDVETYEERQERLPIDYKQVNYLDPALQNDLKSAASNFIDDAFKFGQEAASLEKKLTKSLNTLDSLGFFDKVKKEADKAYNHFQKIGEQFEDIISQGLEDSLESRNVDTHEGFSKQASPGSFPERPYNTKSDQDTYDV